MNDDDESYCVGVSNSVITRDLPDFYTARYSCGAVYCNRSCLWVGVFVGVWVGLLPRAACISHHQTVFVNLQLIKFWTSRAPGRGLRRGENFWLRQRAVFASPLSAFSFFLLCSSCLPPIR